MARGTIPDDHRCVHEQRARTRAQERGRDRDDRRPLQTGSSATAARAGFAPGVRIAQIDVEAGEFYSGAEIELGRGRGRRDRRARAASRARRPQLRECGRCLAPSLATARDENEAKLRASMESDAMPIDPHGWSPRCARRCRATRRCRRRRDDHGDRAQIMPSYGERRLFNAGTTAAWARACRTRSARSSRARSRRRWRSSATTRSARRARGRDRARASARRSCSSWPNNEGIAGHMIQDNFFPPGSPRIAALLPAALREVRGARRRTRERVEQPSQIRPRSIARSRRQGLGRPRALRSEGVAALGAVVYLR
jgi:hypothetical protein